MRGFPSRSRRGATAATAFLVILAASLVVLAALGAMVAIGPSGRCCDSSTGDSTSTSPHGGSTTSVGRCSAAWPTGVSTDLEPAVARIMENSSFVALAAGRCFAFATDFTVSHLSSHSYANYTVFVFTYESGTVVYPCALFPVQYVSGEIRANVTLNGAEQMIALASISAYDASQANVINCPDIPAGVVVGVRSVTLLSPALPGGPTIEVKLDGFAADNVTSLSVVLSIEGKNQTFQFSGVTPSDPLRLGAVASSTETIIGPAAFDSNATYPLQIIGTDQAGLSFSYTAQVKVVDG